MGAILMFLLSRFLFQKHTERYINRHRLSKHIFAFLSTHGFLSVLTVRLLPIFPSTLLNLVASISKIPVSSFCFGTILGKLPTMLAFTFAGQQWKQNPWIAFFFIGVYVLLLFWLTKKIRLYVLQTKNAKE
ncbi:TVP38/TMEM64 family inner membrane protein YdjZ [compost metagenome]